MHIFFLFQMAQKAYQQVLKTASQYGSFFWHQKIYVVIYSIPQPFQGEFTGEYDKNQNITGMSIIRFNLFNINTNVAFPSNSEN